MTNPYDSAVPTVSIVGQDGKELRINKSDFENPPEGVSYTEWSEPSAPVDGNTGKSVNNKDGSKKKKQPASDDVRAVIDQDGRYFVADGSGNVIDDPDHFSSDGYETDAAAWGAITAAIGK